MYQKEIIDLNFNSSDLELFFENLPKDIGKSLNRFLVLGSNLFFKSNSDVSLVQEINKNVLYDNLFYEVGPLSRNLSNKKIQKLYNEFQDSIYTRITARIYEGILILKYLIKKLNKIDICEASYIKPKIYDSKGSGIIEAPRGSLIHQIEIQNEKIKNYNIIVPTQFNLSSSSDKSNLSPAQKALIGEKVEYTDTIFKCFDICAVCVGH